jgi:hypothetical protein
VVKTLGVSFLLMAAGVVLICTFDPDGAGRKLRTYWDRGFAYIKRAVGGEGATRPTTFTVTPSGEEPAAGRRDATGGVGAGNVVIVNDPVLSSAKTSTGAGGVPSEATLLKMDELYRAGKAAEQRGDFESAVRSWEAIKSLGLRESLYPLDLDAQIARARRQMK